jgi:hypothetical protein
MLCLCAGLHSVELALAIHDSVSRSVAVDRTTGPACGRTLDEGFYEAADAGKAPGGLRRKVAAGSPIVISL